MKINTNKANVFNKLNFIKYVYAVLIMSIYWLANNDFTPKSK